MRILGIDPGTAQSAYCLIDGGRPLDWDILPNAQLADKIASMESAFVDVLAIEWVSFYGKEIHAGSETFDTCRWVGHFERAWNDRGTSILIPRRQVKSELCGTQKAGDAEVRAILIDRYGGKERAIGRKATPGPLYGIASHVWSALAVALTYADRQAVPSKPTAARIVEDADVPF